MTTQMTNEDVARRLGIRPGYRLLTYREVGLPFWEMMLRCRMLGKKSLPALDEFTLRCLDAELATGSQISAFLGLPSRVVDIVMGRLLVSSHIVPRPTALDGELEFVLTLRGRNALVELGEVTAEEKELPLAYDGLLRRFTLVDSPLRWRPRDLRGNGIVEIPAFPADPPSVGPAETDEVAGVVRNIRELSDFELLSVLDVVGRREKFFVRALALVFESIDRAGDVAVHFAIDGRPSEPHDDAFARAEGQRKLGIVGSLKGVDGSVEALLGPSVLERRSDDANVIALRRATETFQARLTDVEDQLAARITDEADTGEGIAQVEVLRERLNEAEAALERLPARLLEVHEHPALLHGALTSAEERLLIVSPWIRAAVVDADFIRSIEGALDRGVGVSIGYGIDDAKAVFERDAKAEEKLQQLAVSRPNFRFVRLGDTHAKVLVVDRRYVIVTSFNWLSFRGDAGRPFRDERGTLVTIPEEIDRIYDEYLARMVQD
jgi:PLD-like domain